MLPYKLVGFSGRRKTWEAIECRESSYVIWKCQFEIVPKPSRKSYELWNNFMDWLLEKQIEMIVDFENKIETVYEMSSNGVYVKKWIGNTEVIFKENEIRYG